VGRRALAIGWAVLIIGLAAASTAAVDLTRGAARGVFAFEPFHIAGHLLLFGVLAALLAHARPKRGVLAVVAFLLVAVVQEYVQAALPGHRMTWDSAFDLAVDCVGGVLGVLAYRWWSQRPRVRARS
jgi:VanZ family protein